MQLALIFEALTSQGTAATYLGVVVISLKCNYIYYYETILHTG